MIEPTTTERRTNAVFFELEGWEEPYLRERLPSAGFTPLTPPGSRSPIISFTFDAGRPVADQLKRARINARVGPRYLRISPSIFNGLDDAGRLVEALSQGA